jgi:hypothetical protein
MMDNITLKRNAQGQKCHTSTKIRGGKKQSRRFKKELPSTDYTIVNYTFVKIHNVNYVTLILAYKFLAFYFLPN